MKFAGKGYRLTIWGKILVTILFMLITLSLIPIVGELLP